MVSFLLRAAAAGWAIAALAGCAYEVSFQPAYVPPAKPSFIADGRLLIVMPREQREFVYKGRPVSVTGDYTTLTIPLGEIVEGITKEVFGGCFARGVDVVDSVGAADDFVLVLEGDMQEFAYSYTRVIDRGFMGESAPDSWIVPELDIAFHVKARNRSGVTVLDKIYDSGVRSGESYRVTGHPAERINRVLHETLHGLMLQLAVDVHALLLDECKITETAAQQ